MLTDCCGEEEEAAVSLFQPLGEASKLGHCLSFPQRANAPAEGTQEKQCVPLTLICSRPPTHLEPRALHQVELDAMAAAGHKADIEALYSITGISGLAPLLAAYIRRRDFV